MVSIILAIGTYRLIERPFRFGRARRIGGVVLPALLLSLAGAGAAAYQSGGFVFRIPAQIRPYLSSEYDWSEHARVGSCWLSNSAGASSYDRSCFESSKGGRRSVLIWGDSHAGRLYPGLVDVFGAADDIGQFTRDVCPPLLGFGYAICRDANEYVLSRIARARPDLVILFAAWNHYASSFENGQMQERLAITIERLRASGSADIVVIGPPPQWTIGLPRVLANSWFKSFGLKPLPLYERNGLTAEAFTFDKSMKSFLSTLSVEYVSLLDTLCNVDGCLTIVDDRADGLMTADYGHLTHAGSDYVARRLRDLSPSIAGP